MKTQSEQIAELINELHEVNEKLHEAARPLQSPAEMDLDDRQHVGDQIRDALGRWESVRQRISAVLQDASDAA